MAVLIQGHEFLVPSDPYATEDLVTDPPDNPLDTASAWWGLGLPAQVALRWAVVTGGTAYASDETALTVLARDGLVVEHDGVWSATDAGRRLLEEANR